VYGYEKAMKYINGQRRNVQNDKPIIGIFGVNKEGSGDMYYKGSLMLNTLRSVINNDDKWWAMILKYSETYRKQIIDTETVIAFFNKESGKDLTPIFNQYLRHKNIPVLQLKLKGDKLEYRWKTDVKNFKMPVDVMIDDKAVRLESNNDWQSIRVTAKSMDDIKPEVNKFFIKTEVISE
jgi:aminopeptidase N